MEQKDISIQNIVRHLQSKLGVDNIIINDFWDADNFAIGLTDKDHKNLVYISSWKKRSNEFYLSLECPADNDNVNRTAKIFDSNDTESNKSLKTGLFLLSVGLGLFTGMVIDNILDTEPAGVFVCILIFGGFSLI